MQKKLTVLFAFAIFVLVVGWAITPAQADHCKGKHKNDLGCDRGGDGETPTIVTTDVQWGGNIREPEKPGFRPCVARQVKTTGDYGAYGCQLDLLDTNSEVFYNLGVGVQTARKGDGMLCDVFNGISLTPDWRYDYNWTDNCSDGKCTIKISNWFQNDNGQVSDATLEKADFIRLSASAEARASEQTGTDSFTDANPFVDSLNLNVDEINIAFFGAGSSHKTIAVCHYEPDNVTYHSNPTQ